MSQTEEIFGRLQQVQYAFLTPSNLLDDNYDCQPGEVDEDVEKEELFVEGKRLQYFRGSFRKR